MTLSWDKENSTITSDGLTSPYTTHRTEEPMSISDNRTTNESSKCFVLMFESVIPWDNADSVVSVQTEDLVRRLKDIVILPILFLIGGPANVINMAVFYRQGLKERINVCLFFLSLFDFLFLVSNMIFFAEQIPLQLTTRQKYGPVALFIINNNLVGFYGFTCVSQIISAIIASERCFCILQPLRSQTVMQNSTTTAIIIVIGIATVSLYSVAVTRYRLVCAYDPLIGSDVWMIFPSQFYYDHQNFVDFLDAFMFGMGIPVGMMMVVMVTTKVTIIKLRQATTWRAGTSSSTSVSAREVALTMMLVYNSIFFIVCAFPEALFRLVKLFIPELNAGRRQHNLFFICIWLTDMLSFVNATFNIIFYYTMGSRYRQTFWQLLGKKDQASSNTSSESSRKSSKTSCAKS